MPVAIAACALSAGTGAASAADGGGVGSPSAPELADVRCLEDCAGLRRATERSRIELSGASLEDVSEVSFRAKDGGRTDVEPTAAEQRRVEARVPAGAVTGTVKVKSSYGAEAQTPTKLAIVDAEEIPEAGDFKLAAAEAKPRKTYYYGIESPRVSYMFRGKGATDVRIEVVEAGSGDLVKSWVERSQQPNAPQTAKWNGRKQGGGLAPNGDYRFRIGPASGGRAETTEDARFGFYKYKFPIRAKHSYGDGFGAGRGHQGQDVFAKCGSKLVAARGGRVQWNKSHSSAGWYVVIDGKGTSEDFMYAHLRKRSPLKQGSRVRTGEYLGQVGDTGNASGCHLHFEVWSRPGWYEGGSAMPSVTRMLKAWDRWS